MGARGSPRRWTRERALAAMKAEAMRRGGMPGSELWGGPPSAGTLVNLFGSWREAVEAAGYTPKTRGAPRKARCAKGHAIIETERSRFCRDCKRDRERRRARPTGREVLLLREIIAEIVSVNDTPSGAVGDVRSALGDEHAAILADALGVDP